MEPRIQYAKTSDGVSIAFWTLGDGEPPLVVLPTVPISHIEREWRLPSYRHWYESLAAKRMLIRYDSRGHGLSDDINADYSLASYVMDLEAVVDRLDLKQVALFGAYQAGQPAIGYAARNPNRVSHLLLWCSYAQGTDPLQTAQIRATRRLVEEDWRTWLETVTHIMFGWSAGDERRQTAQAFSEMTDPETLQAFWEANTKIDVTPLLPSVKAPTLVLHRREFRMVDVGVARKMASTIPAARLVLLEGGELAPFAGHTEAAQQAIDEFLGGDEEGAVIAELPEGMAVILFADIAESTALTEQLGDAEFRSKARELDTSLRTIIRESSGTPVEGKLVGDGLMAVFTSARQAIEAALKCDTAAASVGLQLHLGIHAGDVIREGNNVYGGAVNIAARIAAASDPGEVLVSDTVRGLARTSAGVTFEDRGERTLKGIAEPQRLFAVRARE